VPGCGREGIGEVAKQATKPKKYGAISAGGSGLPFFSASTAILQRFFSVGCQDRAVVTGGAV
jgi:hypothetical protein